MSKHHIKPVYAKFDPGHLFDGLFVPTNGKRRDKLYVPPRRFGDLEISFQGYEQLGADDQSFLLAITAQLGIDGLVIGPEPKGPISQSLRLKLDFEKDDGAMITSKRISLRSLLIDAGYPENASTDTAKIVLNRLRAAQIREINHQTGWDRACNLISISFNNKTKETYVAANPRLSKAVFHGQHIKVSLFERNELNTEVAKILHCWLCSNIRLGGNLGRNGVHIDTLAPHIWGLQWESFSKQIKSNKRYLLQNALHEIVELTKGLQRNNGWHIEESNNLIFIARPKKLPFIEGVHQMTPSEFHAAMTEDTYEKDCVDYS